MLSKRFSYTVYKLNIVGNRGIDPRLKIPKNFGEGVFIQVLLQGDKHGKHSS